MIKKQNSVACRREKNYNESNSLYGFCEKEAARFFGEEILPLLGIRGRVRRIAPTEQELEKIKENVNMTVLGEMIRQDGIEIGRREGRQEGEERVNRLNGALIDMGRIEDLKRASRDREFQEKLMEELFPEEKKGGYGME